MTKTDITTLRIALITAFDKFQDAFSQFSELEVNQKFHEGSWTPAQVASHIILATDGVPDHKTGPVNRPADSFLPMIRPWWEDLNQKFRAPDPLKPGDMPRKKSEVLSELKRVREKDLSILDKKDLEQACLDFELPSIGFLTRYEWLWFIEMHLKRHTYQLNNMKHKN